jgi:hypothetical protein
MNTETIFGNGGTRLEPHRLRAVAQGGIGNL